MKKDIHPTYHPNAKIKCACGAVFAVGSTKPEIHVEICGSCHPFYTGEEKLLDTMGRVEKFKSRRAQISKNPVRKKSIKKAEKKARKEKLTK